MVSVSGTVSGASCPCCWFGIVSTELTAIAECSLVLLVAHRVEVFAGTSVPLSVNIPEKAGSKAMRFVTGRMLYGDDMIPQAQQPL